MKKLVCILTVAVLLLTAGCACSAGNGAPVDVTEGMENTAPKATYTPVRAGSLTPLSAKSAKGEAILTVSKNLGGQETGLTWWILLPFIAEGERASVEVTVSLPEGCTVLDNDWGTAPGVAMEADGIHVLMLPGPPRECEMMFRHRAVPYLKGLSEGVIVSRTVKTFGIGESAAEALLRDLMNSLHNPTLAPYAKPTGTELRVTAHARTEAEALARITPVVDQVKALLGDKVIGVDVSCLEEVCYGLLKERGLTVGTAESCTGGLLAKLLTDLPGSSALFRGGIVSYTNAVKAGVLGVPQTLLDQYGAVSPQVAEAMARGAKAVLGCDIALSTTGVAGPEPDDRGNPIGLVYLGLAWGEQCQVVPLHAGQVDRDRIRRQAAQTALDLLRRHLTGL